MENEITLSYVLTTFNKIEYLKISLPLLINACGPDEEIIITDGGSTDGTSEYLSDLHQQGKIHQFISKKDFGEAHGTNKSILMARGKLIKLITDDDAYYFPLIKKCKEFMFENPEMDVLAGNMAMIDLNNPYLLRYDLDFQNKFLVWSETGKTFFFCGLTLMIRKSSLPLTGLFHTRFIAIDVEFSTRITYLNLNLAWCTSPTVVAIRNPLSNTSKYSESYRKKEEEKASIFYNWDMSNRYSNSLTKRINQFKIFLKPLTDKIRGPRDSGIKNYQIDKNKLINSDLSEKEQAFQIANYWLSDINKNGAADFLIKKQR